MHLRVIADGLRICSLRSKGLSSKGHGGLGRLVMTQARQISDASSRMARGSCSRGLTDWRNELAEISQISGNSLYMGRNNLHSGMG